MTVINFESQETADVLSAINEVTARQALEAGRGLAGAALDSGAVLVARVNNQQNTGPELG